MTPTDHETTASHDVSLGSATRADRPPKARALPRLRALLLAGFLAACGGGQDPVTTATVAVGPTGGQLTIDAATLALPAGALGAEVTVVLESPPADAASGELLRLRLSPAGRRLATSAVLTVDVPGALAATQAFWLVDGDPVFAPSTRQGDRFSVPLDSMGFGIGGRREALAARRPGALATGDSTAGELSMRVLNCQGKVEILRRRLARLSTSDAMAEAELLANALIDAAQTCDELEVQRLRQAACEQLAAAATDASLTLPTSLSELGAVVGRLLGAQSVVESAGATCSPEVDVSALIADRADGFLAILAGQVRRGDFATEPGLRELRALFEIEAGCQLLSLDEACDRLRTLVFPNMLDAMRRSAFDDCLDRGAALSVAQFLDLGSDNPRDGPFMGLGRFRMAEIEADLVQCTAPKLSVRVFDTVDGSPQDLPERDVDVQPLNGFNDYRLAATVRPPRSGQFVLDGPIRVARCPDGSAPAAELVVRIADGAQREVARRPHDGVRFAFTPPIDLTVTELLQAAALDPATATNVSLSVTQEGASCPSVVNSGQVVLTRPLPFFRLDVVVTPRIDPVIVAGGATGGTVGIPYRFTPSASGGTGTFVWSVSADTVSGDSLPGGLTLDASTGAISGIPTTAGTSSFTLRATSGDDFGELRVSITIGSDLARLTVNGVSDFGSIRVFSTDLNSGQVGVPYRGRMLASGANGGGWTGRVTSVPAGIDCTFSESSTGGTCFADFPLGTRVRLSASDEGRSTFVRWSSPCDGTRFIGSCTVDMIRSGTVGAFFRNGNWEAIAVNSPLPPGLTLDAVTGLITGTPTAAISPTLKFRTSGGGEFAESVNIRIEIRP
jgi:Putative Ig domain